MNDLKTARALQHSILGKGRWAAPCGCIFIVWGNFPKKPWIHIQRLQNACNCNFDCDNAYGPTCLMGWVNKLTAKRVPAEEFDDAWLLAKKSVHEELELVRVSTFSGVALDRSFLYMHPKSAPMNSYISSEWPPKMFEVFKVAK